MCKNFQVCGIADINHIHRLRNPFSKNIRGSQQKVLQPIENFTWLIQIMYGKSSDLVGQRTIRINNPGASADEPLIRKACVPVYIKQSLLC